MAKNIVFLVHGMGSHFASAPNRAGWDVEVVHTLDDAWSKFPALQDIQRSELIEYVPITYDQIFREYLHGIGDDAARLRTFMPSDGLKDVFDVLQGASKEEADFFWANIMDVLDYHFGGDHFRDVHAHIALAIAAKANEVWAKPDHQNATFSVIAHSLGTATVHGALNRLGGGNIGGSAAFRIGGAFRLRTYVSVANVSRVLWAEHGELYDGTIVRPATPALGRGYVDQFINVRHAADPIVAPKPFGPKDWGTAYQAVAVQHVRSMNLHDWSHYLEHPSVSGRIFRSVLGEAFLTAQDVTDAEAGFPDVALADPVKKQRVEALIADIAKSLRDAYGADQSPLASIPRLFALLLRDLYKNREALRPLLEAT